ncbi:MAG: methyltransferase domain-containing protein [Bacteroidetes bacterium]|nr:MAG: methyltransferase domain-containing protein [Bacteroidota bacterium]
MNLLREYIHYLLTAKTRFGIHSPFVFDLVSNGMTVQMQKTTKNRLKKIRKDYLGDHRELLIHDEGAGSKKLGNKRKVAQIARSASTKGVYGKLLYQLVKHYDCQRVLELGTSLGMGSFHMALASEDCKVYTVDACSNTQQEAKKTAETHGIQNIHFIHQNFNEYLNSEKQVFDLVFIDGHHDGKALLNYLERILPMTHDQSLIILDDIRWSKDMFEAWQQVIQDQRFHLSLDFFRMGVLLKRPEQAKEHFVIRLRNVIFGMI